ncbi:MAG TPA: ribosome biogenesis GTPase Der [Rhodospirillaceae bacterium]|nr:MAG: ribosome biogenesis GTPase Der [Alphaproteobacteria bacterium GWF2_58_20]HAU29458.1 ribosome biogenesis GTPase Der [Rhodospirillaceae bacterium]
MALKVAIIGRPNAGKSTLFNRLAGRQLALVDDTPGVTRDWRSADARLAEMHFEIIDTAGLENITGTSLEARMRQQTEMAMRQADVLLFMLDARAGVTPDDRHFALWLRKQEKPVIIIANKCDSKAGEAGMFEAYELGLGEPVAFSASHGLGMSDLAESLRPYALAVEKAENAGEREDCINLAIAGRPNVGKSTLLNALIGEERMLTGPEPGMTRDSIAVKWRHRGRLFQISDTAGLRKKGKIDEKLEKLAASDTIRAIRYADVVVLVLDATANLEKQDLSIARHVIEEGRALVIAVNKWDLVENHAETLKNLRERIEESLAQAKGVPTICISALRGEKLGQMLDAALKAYETWNLRISTSHLNRWLEDATAAHPPPLAADGRTINIRYMTQVKARPPTFALFLAKATEIPESYLRYLANGMRETFGMHGVPMRLLARKGKNPYDDKTKRPKKLTRSETRTKKAKG